MREYLNSNLPVLEIAIDFCDEGAHNKNLYRKKYAEFITDTLSSFKYSTRENAEGETEVTKDGSKLHVKDSTKGKIVQYGFARSKKGVESPGEKYFKKMVANDGEDKVDNKKMAVLENALYLISENIVNISEGTIKFILETVKYLYEKKPRFRTTVDKR